MIEYNKRAIIAIGGNSLTPTDLNDWVGSQFKNTRTSVESIIPLLKDGYSITLTHGNGPQVGVALRRVEMTANELPNIPLGVLVAETEGSIGYMIEQSLQNALRKHGLNYDVLTVASQVVVDKNDPKLKNPSKFVGSFFTKEQAEELAKENGWVIKKDSDRGYRRVVGSPKPIDIINKKIISSLLNDNIIVIAAGGGGIPVSREEDGTLTGLDAVIDKDFASAKLANMVNADELFIMTAVDKVAINFGTPEQENFSHLTLEEAKKHLNEGQFPDGSMGPKMKAAIDFLENGGKRVIITSIDKLASSVEGKNGTSITK